MLLTGFLLCCLSLAAANPLQRRWGDFVVKHSWIDTPRGWEYYSDAPPDHLFDMRIGLKQSRIDDLINELMEVSDPSHARYGQHLTQEEAELFVKPRPESVEEVKNWLTFHGIDGPRITHSAGGGDWITVQVSVAEAEKMLDAKYNVYSHPASGEKVVRTMGYSLPRDLHSHVDVVTPTTYFSTLRSMRKTSFLQPEIQALDLLESLVDQGIKAVLPASCSSTITPACLRGLYNTVDYVPRSVGTNRLGVAGYLDEFANNADLKTFLNRFRPDAANATFPTVRVNNGGNDQSDPGVEANLDIQYTIGMSHPTPNIYYSTGGSPPFDPDSETPTNTNEPYLDWLNFISNQTTIPQVITTSYGDDEQTVPPDYAVRVCNSFAALGTRGTTLLFSSGDFGVGGGDCRTNDGKNQVLFQPVFPASCPFVTAVGGTTRINPETAISFSGGGFSRYFAQPSYQSANVTTFLTAIGTKNAGLFNTTGRAYPDLAAQAQGFQVVIGGLVKSVGGTSASSPTVAGIFALLNDYRLSMQKTPLGFLNPLIYSIPAGFNDIVSGSNPGCRTNGFTAVKGWDPVTGLGTPDFLKLQKLL